ncbi:hypothetical protein ACFVH4_31130 [Nocardia ignorata]|uniref:hypothetical protein n=1 Tax=Nocardia ignorata TaxID=145285 RepID=UPI0036313802
MRAKLFRTLAPLVLVTAALLGSACGDNTAAAPVPPTTSQQVPQDAGHARLNQLVGEWTAEKSTFVAGGTPENPIVTRDAVSRWSWVAAVIRLESPDRTVMELYFTPPGEPERLADRVVLTRRR